MVLSNLTLGEMSFASNDSFFKFKCVYNGRENECFLLKREQ